MPHIFGEGMFIVRDSRRASLEKDKIIYDSCRLKSHSLVSSARAATSKKVSEERKWFNVAFNYSQLIFKQA